MFPARINVLLNIINIVSCINCGFIWSCNKAGIDFIIFASSLRRYNLTLRPKLGNFFIQTNKFSLFAVTTSQNNVWLLPACIINVLDCTRVSEYSYKNRKRQTEALCTDKKNEKRKEPTNRSTIDENVCNIHSSCEDLFDLNSRLWQNFEKSPVLLLFITTFSFNRSYGWSTRNV